MSKLDPRIRTFVTPKIIHMVFSRMLNFGAVNFVPLPGLVT